MPDRGETPRVPDLEFPDKIPVRDTMPANYPEAPDIARAIMAAAEAAQHRGNRSPEGSDKPNPGHYTATRATTQQLRGTTPAFGRASDADWTNVGRHE